MAYLWVRLGWIWATYVSYIRRKLPKVENHWSPEIYTISIKLKAQKNLTVNQYSKRSDRVNNVSSNARIRQKSFFHDHIN